MRLLVCGKPGLSGLLIRAKARSLARRYFEGRYEFYDMKELLFEAINDHAEEFVAIFYGKEAEESVWDKTNCTEDYLISWLNEHAKACIFVSRVIEILPKKNMEVARLPLTEIENFITEEEGYKCKRYLRY